MSIDLNRLSAIGGELVRTSGDIGEPELFVWETISRGDDLGLEVQR